MPVFTRVRLALFLHDLEHPYGALESILSGCTDYSQPTIDNVCLTACPSNLSLFHLV